MDVAGDCIGLVETVADVPVIPPDDDDATMFPMYWLIPVVCSEGKGLLDCGATGDGCKEHQTVIRPSFHSLTVITLQHYITSLVLTCTI